MSLTVKGNKNYEKIDDIINGTWNYLEGYQMFLPSPVKFEGTVSTINSEIDSYYTQALVSMGATTANGYKALHLTIDTTTTKNTAITYIIIIGALFVGGIVFLVRDIMHNKKLSAMPIAQTQPMSMSAADDLVFGNMAQANNQSQNTASMTDDNNTLYR